MIIIYLAGLLSIPSEVYEAAALDGATAWRAFTHVTLPLIFGYLIINSVLGLKGFLNTYEIPVALTGGGPGTSTHSGAIEAGAAERAGQSDNAARRGARAGVGIDRTVPAVFTSGATVPKSRSDVRTSVSDCRTMPLAVAVAWACWAAAGVAATRVAAAAARRTEIRILVPHTLSN